MHRRFAAWLVGQPWRAFLIGAGFAALSPQGFSPFALVASATAILVILSGDSPGAVTRGMAVAVASFAVATATLLSISQPVVVAAGLAALAFLVPALLGVLLKRTGSLTLCFQLAVLGMAVLLVGIYASLDNPSVVWEQLLRDAVTSLQARGVVLANPEEMITGFARTMWGAYAALVLLGTLSSLFLARWWQSLLEAPGGFGDEYRELRLGKSLGVVAIVVIVAAALTDIELVDCLSWIAMSALAYQGLAAAHRRKAAKQLGQGGLVAIYVFLIVPLSAFVMVTLLAAWGVADNWRQLKGVAGA